MPRKQRNQHKKQQRALQKRTKRKQKLARKQTQAAVGINPRRLLRMARRMPIEGAWVQEDWREHGIARITLARTQPDDRILFGAYMVDCFCTGLRETSTLSNIARDTFFNEIIPRLYPDNPPIKISENLAHEIIWGAIEYAIELGFEPHRDFRESSRILESADTLPRIGGVEFGYQGDPLYIPAPDDNQAGVIRRLIESVGLGNFYYMPQGDIPEDVVEIMELTQHDDTPEPMIWTPGQDQPGIAETRSGLWVPGQPPETASEGEQAEQSLIWTPGRS